MLSQSEVFALNANQGEPNACYQISTFDSLVVLSGRYFSEELGRWSVYMSKIDFQGNIKEVIVEEVDTVIGVSLSNNSIIVNDQLCIFGTWRNEILLWAYDPNNDSTSIIDRINMVDNDFIAHGIGSRVNSQIIYYTGINADRNQFKVIKSQNSENEILTTSLESSQITRVSDPLFENENIYFFASKSSTNNQNDTINLIKVEDDGEFEIITNVNEPSVLFDLGSISYIDEQGNLLCSGLQKCLECEEDNFLPIIAKFDKQGKVLWTKSIFDSTFENVDRWSNWNSIIESVESDGYIIVGSVKNQEYLDSISVNAAIAKINYEGELVWYKELMYKSDQFHVANIFNDITLLNETSPYVIAGSSFDFIPIGEDNPWSQSIFAYINDDGLISNNKVLPSTEYLELTLFPNPTTNNIYLNSKNPQPYNVSLYDIHGNQVMQLFKVELDKYELDVSNLVSGYYVIKLEKGNSSKSFKVLINR